MGIGNRPLSPADYMHVPVGPPTRTEVPDGVEEDGWIIGQSGDRRVTEDEREVLYWAMRPYGRFCQKLERGYVPYRRWHVSYAVRFQVQYKNGMIDEADLRYYGEDEGEALAFFEGRVHWGWFVGERVLKIGQVPVTDPHRVTQEVNRQK